MGLGLLGRGLAVAKFLAESGAKLTITDLKTKEQLADSINELRDFIKERELLMPEFVLGEHRLEDFVNTDMVIRAPNAPVGSAHLAAARRAGGPVEMDASLFAKLAPEGVVIVGVTGTRGKTTTTHLIYEILKAAGHRAYIGGNIRNGVTLPFLKKVKPGDYVVLELDSWQLQGFGEAGISPHIAVFTSFMPDHMNYYQGDMDHYFQDKSNIFKFQKKGDHLIIQADVAENYPISTEARIHKVEASILPRDLKTNLLGLHNLNNVACALKTTEVLSIPESVIVKTISSFKPVPGRLEPLGKKKGVMYINDNNSTTPDATIAALRAVGDEVEKDVVLIFGGDDKKLDMSGLIAEIPRYCRKVVMFKERGTDKIRDKVRALESEGVEVYEEEGLPVTVARAVSIAEEGDTVLYSPAFSSFGKYFKNEYDRGDQFVELFKKIK